jgi:hypothetical protein
VDFGSSFWEAWQREAARGDGAEERVRVGSSSLTSFLICLQLKVTSSLQVVFLP